MRSVEFIRNYVKYPAGSCLAVFGDTKVLCTASLEERVPRFLENTGQGWISAEYGMLPGSTSGGRKRRPILKRDGRSTEIQRLIGRSLRAAVDLEKIPELSIALDCDVIQADGGTRTAAISGAYVALYDALGRAAEILGTNRDNMLLGQVAAVSVGIVEDKVICDLDYARDSQAQVDMNVVKRGGEFVEVQGTGEKDTFSFSQLQQLLGAADEGIAYIFRQQKAALGL
ncbi:MAG: ribonuclease PH [Spirochaetia bacterium]